MFARLMFAATMLIGAGPLASAETALTYKDAVTLNMNQSLKDGGIAFLFNQGQKFVTSQMISKETFTTLTDADIQDIMARVEKSWTSGFGVGELGGDRIILTYDADQVARVAGVKSGTVLTQATTSAGAPVDANVRQAPVGVAADEIAAKVAKDLEPNFVTKEFNTFTTSDIEGKLKEIQAAKASVRTVTYRGLLMNNGIKVAGVLQWVFVASSASNAVAATYNSLHTFDADAKWQSESTAPDWFNYMFNHSAYVSYHFTPDPVQK